MLPILQEKPVGVRDPVCGMTVDPQKAAGSVAYQGQTYYFCSSGCAAKFQAAPQKYLDPKPMPPAAAGDGIHLPDASRSPANRPWILPQVRHGPGAGQFHSGIRG